MDVHSLFALQRVELQIADVGSDAMNKYLYLLSTNVMEVYWLH